MSLFNIRYSNERLLCGSENGLLKMETLYSSVMDFVLGAIVTSPCDMLHACIYNLICARNIAREATRLWWVCLFHLLSLCMKKQG